MNNNDVIIKLEPLVLNFNLKEVKIESEQNHYIIYKTVNISKNENDENRFYVGKHVQHIDLNLNDGYYGSGHIIIRSLKKYGEDCHIRTILEVCDDLKHLKEREMYWIETLSANGSIYPECGGMNLTNGGGSEEVYRTPESRKKMSDYWMGRLVGDKNPMFGRNHTEETKKLMSNIVIERNYNGERNPNYGNGEKMKGDKNPSKRPEVREKLRKYDFTVENIITKEIKHYKTVEDICKDLNAKENSIRGCLCRGHIHKNTWKITKKLKEDKNENNKIK